MVYDCSGHTGGLCSSENKSLLQTFMALCMLDASEAYLEPQHSEAALPCDNAVHNYRGKDLTRVESVLPSIFPGICLENSLQPSDLRDQVVAA